MLILSLYLILSLLFQEDFLDLQATVAGSSGLGESLQAAYLDTERLDGRNQYRCGSCNRLVDAEKVSLLNLAYNHSLLKEYVSDYFNVDAEKMLLLHYLVLIIFLLTSILLSFHFEKVSLLNLAYNHSLQSI